MAAIFLLNPSQDYAKHTQHAGLQNESDEQRWNDDSNGYTFCLSFSHTQLQVLLVFSTAVNALSWKPIGTARHMKDLRTNTPSTRPHHLSPLISNSGSSPDSLSVPPTKTPPPTPNICPLSRFAVSGCFSCPSSSRVGRRLPRSSMETLVMLCKQTDSFIKIIFLLMYNFYILWRHFSTVFFSTLLYFFLSTFCCFC